MVKLKTDELLTGAFKSPTLNHNMEYGSLSTAQLLKDNGKVEKTDQAPHGTNTTLTTVFYALEMNQGQNTGLHYNGIFCWKEILEYPFV